MTSLFLIILMATLFRLAGGGLGAYLLNKTGAVDENTGEDLGGKMPFNLTMLPEILFSIVFGIVTYIMYGIPLLSLAIVGWTYALVQTGHGAVLPWGRPVPDSEHSAYKNRKQRLTPIVDFLAKLLKIDRDGPDGLRSIAYCRLFMSVKGYLLGLPLGGIPLAILWPLSYEIGVRVKSHAVSELLAGASAGLSMVLFLIL